MRELHIKNGDGFLLIFAVDDLNTYEDIPNIHNTVLNVKKTETFPMVIVGNKIDLKNREITEEQGFELGKNYSVPYMETSALSNTNIQEVFFQCVREIRKFQNSSQSPSQKKKGCLIL